MNTLLGANAQAVLAQYPAASDAAAFQTYVTATSDGAFICRARKAARAVMQGQSEPVFRYLFTQTLRGPKHVYGSFHGLELSFLFRTLGRDGYPVMATDDAVSDTLQSYWGTFARTGDPNDGVQVMWPQNTPTTGEYLSIGQATQAAQGFHAAACNLWETLGLY
jgi:para-nitrobenzyl esterase